VTGTRASVSFPDRDRTGNPLRSLALLFFVAAGLACSCADIPLEKELASTDAVFVAKVIDARYPEQHWTVVNGDSFPEESDSELIVAWRAVASRGWKAQVPETVTVYSELSGGSCGYTFRIGQEYLIYAGLMRPATGYDRGRAWPKDVNVPAAATHLCTRTAPVEASNIEELGRPDWVVKHKPRSG